MLILDVDETSHARAVIVGLTFSVEDEAPFSGIRGIMKRLARQQKRIRILVFNTIATFPRFTLP